MEGGFEQLIYNTWAIGHSGAKWVQVRGATYCFANSYGFVTKQPVSRNSWAMARSRRFREINFRCKFFDEDRKPRHPSFDPTIYDKINIVHPFIVTESLGF
jgi:predicted nucleotidyltransferase